MTDITKEQIDIDKALYILRAYETTHISSRFDVRDLQELEKAVIRGLETQWKPIEQAPKGGGAEMVSDPNWIEPPHLLLYFPDEGTAICAWDWYYAPDGSGYYEGCSGWVMSKIGETTNFHFSVKPTHFIQLSALGEPK